jgi:hypothetical protein
MLPMLQVPLPSAEDRALERASSDVAHFLRDSKAQLIFAVKVAPPPVHLKQQQQEGAWHHVAGVPGLGSDS